MKFSEAKGLVLALREDLTDTLTWAALADAAEEEDRPNASVYRFLAEGKAVIVDDPRPEFSPEQRWDLYVRPGEINNMEWKWNTLHPERVDNYLNEHSVPTYKEYGRRIQDYIGWATRCGCRKGELFSFLRAIVG